MSPTHSEKEAVEFVPKRADKQQKDRGNWREEKSRFIWNYFPTLINTIRVDTFHA